MLHLVNKLPASSLITDLRESKSYLQRGALGIDLFIYLYIYIYTPCRRQSARVTVGRGVKDAREAVSSLSLLHGSPQRSARAIETRSGAQSPGRVIAEAKFFAQPNFRAASIAIRPIATGASAPLYLSGPFSQLRQIALRATRDHYTTGSLLCIHGIPTPRAD